VTLPKLQVCWIVKISRKNAVLSFIPAFASQKKNLQKKTTTFIQRLFSWQIP